MALVCSWTIPLWAQDLEALQRTLWQEQEAREKTQSQLVSLTKKERSAHRKLVALEEKIADLEARKDQIQHTIDSLHGEHKALQAQIKELHSQDQGIRKEIYSLLPRLWEVVVRANHLQAKLFESWTEADRYMVWLSALTGTARHRVQELCSVQNALEEKKSGLENTRDNLLARQNELDAMSRKLTKERLGFLDQVHAIRKKKQSSHEELADLKASIDELKSRLEAMSSREFGLQRGKLPWPAQGKVIVNFGAKDGRFANGLGFSLTQGSDVRAVSWGEVVYNDMLRGFGHVVILYHGQDYYSLYAFLSQTVVRTGQRMEKGETIGQAGYFPISQGPGLYFELRRKQLPIDPRSWLATR
jgi:septal ring factor EnvC (AmiA/AmiB activator)